MIGQAIKDWGTRLRGTKISFQAAEKKVRLWLRMVVKDLGKIKKPWKENIQLSGKGGNGILKGGLGFQLQPPIFYRSTEVRI